MLDYTLTINGVDFTEMVERDSYKTDTVPVFSERFTTMNGVDHTALIRNKKTITFDLNPQTATDTKTACDALSVQPITVYFFDLQANDYGTAKMTLDGQSAQYLSRCLARGLKWNQMDPITLTEL